ncbi:MAG: hypothetical protein AAF658_20580, partial [Myxococcota bacterium]
PILRKLPAPRFVEWHLVSTHAPFATHAPWLNPEELERADPYADRKGTKFDIQWPYLEDAHRGYAWSLDYEFRVLADVLPKLLEEGGVAILVGDHQPNGAMMQPGATWEVPCHVVSPDRETLSEWSRFSPGGTPSFSKDAPPLAELYADILKSELVTWEVTRRDLDVQPPSEASCSMPAPRGETPTPLPGRPPR